MINRNLLLKKEIGYRNPFSFNPSRITNCTVMTVFNCAIIFNITDSAMATVFNSTIALNITDD